MGWERIEVFHYVAFESKMSADVILGEFPPHSVNYRLEFGCGAKTVDCVVEQIVRLCVFQFVQSYEFMLAN